MWVPGPEQEAVRDLTRAREDLKSMERRAKQRLGAFLLRHGKVYQAGQRKWTQRYFRWLEEVKFDHPVQQIVFQEYVDTVTYLQGRVEALEVEMERALSCWSLAAICSSRLAWRCKEAGPGPPRWDSSIAVAGMSAISFRCSTQSALRHSR